MDLFKTMSLTIASCVVFLSHDSEAVACGGCFHGVNEVNPSVVTGHRMALSISQDRTVLWDQVEYAGDPKEFAWVLPVGENAYIEQADDAFFEALEAVTSTRVMSREITCNGQPVQQQAAAGCGAPEPIDTIEPRLTDSVTDQQGEVRGVTVVHEGTVGPYETATIKSNDPQALRNWLTLNGYAIPADVDPVIDGYVAEGAAFIALRLQPGFGVRQMTPVRVITPGASPILPLRMVAAGTGMSTSIVLYVLGEGRYRAAMRPQALISADEVTWDWAAFQSDYATLRANSFEGDTFLTSFSHSGGLTAVVEAAPGLDAKYDVVFPSTNTVGTYDNLVDLYFGQAGANDGLAIECAHVRGTLDAADLGAKVIAPCDAADPTCMPPTNSISSASLECEGHRDLAAALEGLHPHDVWVTRLEANLSRKALGLDLTIEADPDQIPVSNWLVAGQDANLPNCAIPQAVTPPVIDRNAGAGCGCSTPRSSRSFDPAALLLAALALIHGAKHLRRR